MLDVGFSEILLTSAIALIVLGPERLPKVARQVGNWMGRARAMARQLSEQLEREVSAEELLKTQSKANSGGNAPGGAAPSPSSGAAFDPSYSQTIAPPADAPLPADARLPADAPPPLEATPPPSPPEPIYGRPASATTPAAMHASDTADTPPPHG